MNASMSRRQWLGLAAAASAGAAIQCNRAWGADASTRSWNNGTIRQATKVAKKKGGEAMILSYGEESGVIAVVTEGKEPGTRERRALTALVIRWLTQEDVVHRHEALQSDNQEAWKAWQDWQARHPTASFSEDARDLVSVPVEGGGRRKTASLVHSA